MFAEQLLRILQTIPSDVKYETCVSSEQDMTIKDNPNPTHYDSKFGSKEIYPLNGLRSETNPLVSEEKGRNPKFADEHPPSSLSLLSPDTNREDKVSITSFKANERKDTNFFYTNTNILERDKPELMVCYKDINYHVAKDICIDEGTPLNGEILAENGKDDQSSNRSDGLAASSSEGVSANEPEISKLPSESPSDETLSDDNSAEDSFIDKKLPIQEFGTRSFLRSFINSLDDDEGQKEISSGKAVSEGPTEPVSKPESKEDMQAIDSLSYYSKVESQIITFSFDSSTLEPPGVVTNGITEKVNEHSVDSTNAITEKVEEHPVGSNNESVVSREKYESSFSAASGFATHSGPIPFSGSISFRSDGSATSGRSFAFPILQSEWNSSPVRMTKANGGHFRKPKGWRSGLLCCRF